jgi:phosphinothricin acetyltransferase
VSVVLIDCDRSRAPEILAILNDAIVNSTALYDYRPRTLATMDGWFEAKEKGSYPVVGAIDERGTLVGFASYGPFRAWPAYKYSVEHSLYVEATHRGQGLGTLLLGAIIARARAQDYHNLVAGIDAANAVSIALHQRFGFEPCGTIRHAGFMFNRWLDLQFYQLLLYTRAHPIDG